MSSRKQFYDLEKICKGVANHRRIEILFMLKKDPNLSTDDIVERLGVHYQTGAAHVQVLVRTGVVSEHRQGNKKLHQLTPYGVSIIKLLIKL